MVCLILGRSIPHPAKHSSSRAARLHAPAMLWNCELAAARDSFALQDETLVCPKVLLVETGSKAIF